MINIGDRPARLIAFYLPQFHPIPENDAWWGKGFTEWINVAKAKPLFRGHVQPQLPGELGFYDLRVPETRQAQADLAREYGIEGFCYWHYWFAGKRLLERPFNEVMESGNPDFPFCLAWANESWTGIWHGCPDRILIEQTYPGPDDYRRHFETLLPAFRDQRYTRVDGEPIFIVYSPHKLPDCREFAEIWRREAQNAGIGGLHLVGMSDSEWIPCDHGFDAVIPGVVTEIQRALTWGRKWTFFDRACRKLLGRRFDFTSARLRKCPDVYEYRTAVEAVLRRRLPEFEYPEVLSNWDNTPRCSRRGMVLLNSTPDVFKHYLSETIRKVSNRSPEKRLVFLKSWNEWAEGNFLEPSQQWGRAHLEAIRAALLESAEECGRWVNS